MLGQTWKGGPVLKGIYYTKKTILLSIMGQAFSNILSERPMTYEPGFFLKMCAQAVMVMMSLH